ncbi:MAG: cytochrome c biogenesis protein CcsA [Raineya sp.]|jgi:cytochrome c-type biogenesis protein CcmF|nr:cytochrome c biogenesis protein CcsA [Raineya sp.]
MREPNIWIGSVGHLLVLISFVSAITSGLGYFFSQRKEDLSEESQSWLKFGRTSFFVHSGAVLGVVLVLFSIVYNQMYEYFYAYDHSSNDLLVQYMIACFWEGQEGSFLIWIFWNVLAGGILIWKSKTWEKPVMSIFALLQVILTSMLLGVVFFDSFKIGSSPFVLTREVLDLPIYNPAFRETYNPNFIPKDGSGLSPLLQNYWMVIHPPTIFLGFALSFVPFAFAMAGLATKKTKEWLRPAMPWTIVSSAILGLGIVMGAYWAYETLNFGGYWNWDPVENAVYVPWLTLVAALHTMLTARNSSSSLKASIIMLSVTFFLVLYSTFLTRSGVLGDASVHSFTDLGLSGQLLLLMGVFVVVAIWIMFRYWKFIKPDNKEITTYSPEFWTFVSATILFLAAFQVILFTSKPVFGQSPPSNPMELYGSIQGFFAILVAIFSGIGLFYWWRKINPQKSLYQTLALPILVSMVLSGVLIFFLENNEDLQKEFLAAKGQFGKTALAWFKYLLIILIIASTMFSLVANGSLMFQVLRKNPRLSGGAVSHIGIALMILGIMYSAGYSKIISDNNSGLVYNKDAPEEFNKKNVLLWMDEPNRMKDYIITYKGMYVEAQGYPGYINQKYVRSLANDPYKLVAIKDISYNDKSYFKKGDTLTTRPENLFYRVEYRTKSGKLFNLFPRVQMNGIRKGEVVASPDIRQELGKDLYTHVTTIYPDPEKGREYSETQEIKVHPKDTFLLNDFVAVLEDVKRVTEIDAQKLTENEIAVKATVKIIGKNAQYTAEPILLVNQKENKMANIPEILPELGVRLTFKNIDTEKGEMIFSADVGEKDYIIMKAMEKPMINLLWIGSLVIMVGFMIALWRRMKENTPTGKTENITQKEEELTNV